LNLGLLAGIRAGKDKLPTLDRVQKKAAKFAHHTNELKQNIDCHMPFAPPYIVVKKSSAL
jgi:hypothetical protein